jgi:hypothetical protein
MEPEKRTSQALARFGHLNARFDEDPVDEAEAEFLAIYFADRGKWDQAAYWASRAAMECQKISSTTPVRTALDILAADEFDILMAAAETDRRQLASERLDMHLAEIRAAVGGVAEEDIVADFFADERDADAGQLRIWRRNRG